MNPTITAIAFILLLTLVGDSPEPEQITVSKFRQVRGIVTEERHEVTRNRCHRIIHLKEVEVEYER